MCWQLLSLASGLLLAAGGTALLYWLVYLRWPLHKILGVLTGGLLVYFLTIPATDPLSKPIDTPAVAHSGTQIYVQKIRGTWRVIRSWEGRYGYGSVIQDASGHCYYLSNLDNAVLRDQRLRGTIRTKVAITDDGCQKSKVVSLDFGENPAYLSRLKTLGRPVAGLVLAATMADKGWLPRSAKQAYNLRGIGHLLAVSGLHFGLVAFALWWILGVILLPLYHWHNGGDYWQRPLRLLGTGALLTVYATQTGWPDSVLRAWLMVMVVLFWRLLPTYRQQASAIVGLVGWALALAAPEIFSHAGMRMSFWITLALVLGGEIGHATGKKWFTALWILLVPTAITQVIAFDAGFVSGWHAVFNNVLAIPMFSIVILPSCWILLIAAKVGIVWPLMADFLFFAQSRMLDITWAADGKGSEESALLAWFLLLTLLIFGLFLNSRAVERQNRKKVQDLFSDEAAPQVT